MTHIQQRRDTFANWTLNNPVLMDGEAGHETNTGRWKLGDGVTPYLNLPYKSGVDSVAGRTGAVVLGVADVAGVAPIASPTFTGTPRAATAGASDNSTRLATTQWVKNQAYASLMGPEFLGDPRVPTPSAADDDTTIANTKWVKARFADSPILGGNPTAPTPAAGDNDTSIATTEWVMTRLGGADVDLTAPAGGLTLSAGLVIAGEGVSLRKRGKIVTLQFYISNPTGANVANLMVIPAGPPGAGYRPVSTVRDVCTDSAGFRSSTAQPDGQVFLEAGGLQAGRIVYGTLVWATA